MDEGRIFPGAQALQPMPISDRDGFMEAMDADALEPDLELLVRRKAEGDETNDSLNFLNSIAAPVTSKPARPPDNFSKRAVDDLRRPAAATANKNVMEQAPSDSSGVGAAQADLEAMASEAPKRDPNADPEPLINLHPVVRDIAEGTVEAPLQAVGGVADAFNAFGPLATLLQDLSFAPMLQIYDREGQLAPALLTPGAAWDRAMDRFDNPAFKFPTTDKGDTVTGSFVRSAAQWIAGFEDSPIAFAAIEAFVAPFGAAASEYPGQVSGNCMGAAAPGGQFVVISPEQPLKTGDLAAFATTEGFQYIKVLMGRQETPDGPVWMFGQANPPLVAFQREADLLFLHRVRAFADAEGKESEIDLSPVAADLALIDHLRIEGTWRSINSGFPVAMCEVA